MNTQMDIAETSTSTKQTLIDLLSQGKAMLIRYKHLFDLYTDYTTHIFIAAMGVSFSLVGVLTLFNRVFNWMRMSGNQFANYLGVILSHFTAFSAFEGLTRGNGFVPFVVGFIFEKSSELVGVPRKHAQQVGIFAGTTTAVVSSINPHQDLEGTMATFGAIVGSFAGIAAVDYVLDKIEPHFIIDRTQQQLPDDLVLGDEEPVPALPYAPRNT